MLELEFKSLLFKMKSKKAQLTLGDAPTVILIVGLLFLVMATMALIGQKYGDAMPTSSYNVVNETVGVVNETGIRVLKNTECNFVAGTLSNAVNSTAPVLVISPLAGNLSLSSTGWLTYSSTIVQPIVNNTKLNISYSYVASGSGCDINRELGTTISDNTSIAGIVLTISLVGIVLAILIGVFMRTRARI